MFNHPHVRIAQTELKTIAPHNGDALLRTYHSDWPHDLRDLSKSGHILQPFPDITMAVVTLWMLVAVYEGERRHVDCAAQPP